MENAVDALKIAFAVIVFVIAIALAFSIFSQARAVSDAITYASDKTNFEEYVQEHAQANRTVGIETVIPAVRRYVKDNENYCVEIIDGSKTYTFDLLVDQQMNRTPKQIQENLEKSLEELLNKYRNATFKESYSETVYRGGIGEVKNENGETIETVEKINTDTKVKITYTKQ